LYTGQTYLTGPLRKGALPYVPAVTTAAVRRSIFLKEGGFSPRWVHFDVFLWLHLIQTYDVLRIREHFTLTRVHSQQVAVVSRRNLRSYHDFKAYFPTFARELKRSFKLPPSVYWKLRLKPFSQAANLLVVFLHKKDWLGLCKAFAGLPWQLWLPVIPCVARNYVAQNRRNRELWRIVPKAITLE
jgi:hypothetical protein